MGFPPDKYPPIILPNGHPELIGEDVLWQLPMIVPCPVPNQPWPTYTWPGQVLNKEAVQNGVGPWSRFHGNDR